MKCSHHHHRAANEKKGIKFRVERVRFEFVELHVKSNLLMNDVNQSVLNEAVSWASVGFEILIVFIKGELEAQLGWR